MLGACNLVSLFFLETGGRGAGRAVRRPTATTVSSDSWAPSHVNTQQQKNDRHCFEFVQHHMMTILSVELHGLWVSVERMNPLKCNLPLPSIGINHNHLSLVKSHRATEEADQSHRPSVARPSAPARFLDRPPSEWTKWANNRFSGQCQKVRAEEGKSNNGRPRQRW